MKLTDQVPAKRGGRNLTGSENRGGGNKRLHEPRGNVFLCTQKRTHELPREMKRSSSTHWWLGLGELHITDLTAGHAGSDKKTTGRYKLCTNRRGRRGKRCASSPTSLRKAWRQRGGKDEDERLDGDDGSAEQTRAVTGFTGLHSRVAGAKATRSVQGGVGVAHRRGRLLQQRWNEGAATL